MKPLILVTNDDGVLSPGLRAAIEATIPFGDLLICAPRHQQTAMGRSHPRQDDSGIIETFSLIVNDTPHVAYGVYGSPAQAVLHAILELAPRPPVLCVSGINCGENVGYGLTVSGTIGAALEANRFRIPAIAASLEMSHTTGRPDEYAGVDWRVATTITSRLIARVLAVGVPDEVAVLNLNVPSSATDQTEIRLTNQSHQDYWVYARPPKRDISNGHRLAVSVEIDRPTLEPGSDIEALALDRVISLTALRWSLTANTDWTL